MTPGTPFSPATEEMLTIDPPPAARIGGDSGLHSEKTTDLIDVHHRLVIGKGHVLQRRGAQNARVVHEDVQAAHARSRPVSGLDLSFCSTSRWTNAAAGPSSDTSAAPGAVEHIGNQHPSRRPHEEPGGSCALTARPARDESPFTRERFPWSGCNPAPSSTSYDRKGLRVDAASIRRRRASPALPWRCSADGNGPPAGSRSRTTAGIHGPV